MTKFTVPDMSCGHCTAAIEKSVKAADPTARVDCDIAQHSVDVQSSLSDDAVSAAIRDAGYDVQRQTAT